MKISLRILLINFVVVALIFISSTVAYYTLTKKLIVLQNSKVLTNSASDFSITLRSILLDTENDFFRLLTNGGLSNTANIEKSNLDFVFIVNPDSSINPDFFFFSPSVIHSESDNLNSFISKNPNILVQVFKSKKGETYYFGRAFTEDLLDKLSKRIRADIAFLSPDNIPGSFSDSAKNENYLFSLIKASRSLSSNSSEKNNIFIEELDNSDLYASLVKLSDIGLNNKKNSFLIFTTLPEAAELRNNINQLVLIIGITGVALSLILVLLFTEKIRKQITQLSKAAEVIKGGNLHHRVTVLSNDELGHLGTAFNNMLDEIERKEESKNEYTEFISLINENPSLCEVAETALNKIVKSTNSIVGQLYLIEEGNRIELVTSYGIQRELVFSKDKIDLFKQVVEKNESVEFKFTQNYPKINTGLAELELRYILIFPIVYNKNVTAVLELGSINVPEKNIKEYLGNIHDQLAIGLTNANAFRQLENFVKELKILNEDYQKQNDQVTEQNKRLVELHNQLKEKADELEIQKEKAVESTVLKSQFLATVSHELRTPLSSILGLTELVIGDKTLSQPNKEKLKVVLRNGNRLINLINDILEFTKIEAGKAELRKEDFRIKELISDVEIQISPLIQNKNINFVVHNELNTGLLVNSDRDKIMHILVNLLSNAVKFTDEGMVILKTKLVEENILHFEIMDSGIGISERDLNVIFEEFRQVDSTSTRKYSGAGLGLTICKKYADLLNGNISAKSEIGKGSTFIFTLPISILETKDYNADQLSLDLVEESIPLNSAVSQDIQKDKEEPLSEKLILVVDNDPDNQNIVGQYLSSKNYKVIYSSGFDETLQRVSDKLPFAVVINIFSTEKGWQLLKLFKENSKTQHIPIIPLIFIDEFNIGYGLPVLDYLVKPVSFLLLDNYLLKAESLIKTKLNRIFIIDNDTEFFQNVKNPAAEDKEYKFINDGTFAFNQVLKSQPDLIVVDILMEKLDGISLIYQLKESVETKDIPIVITIPETLSEKDSFQLNHNFEKAALKSKKQKIDVLKVIRDRLYLEEGTIIEETASNWPEIKPGTINQENEVPYKSKVKKTNKPKVLIVDDDTDTLFTVGEIVRQAGCDIVFAKNGLECLSSLQMFTPDLILLDIMMPRMDGFETIKRIRAENTLDNVPVFALTAQAMLEDKDIIIRNGFDDFISKPVNASSLISKIEKTVNVNIEL